MRYRGHEGVGGARGRSRGMGSGHGVGAGRVGRAWGQGMGARSCTRAAARGTSQGPPQVDQDQHMFIEGSQIDTMLDWVWSEYQPAGPTPPHWSCTLLRY